MSNDRKSTGEMNPPAFAETDKHMAQAQQLLAAPAIIAPPTSGPQTQQPLAPNSVNAPLTTTASSAPTKRGAKGSPSQGADDDAQPSGTKKRKPGPSSAKKTDKQAAEALLDVSEVTLPGEAAGIQVPVYETCDSMRRNIRRLLKKPGMTQAAFCRALGKFGDVAGAAPTPGQLATFMEKKGALKGNISVIFYSSYVLLEKMRVRDGKEKTKFRKEMEEKWAAEGGVEVDEKRGGPLWLHVTETGGYDRWGRLDIGRRR